jgi:hypothetical protein
MSDQVTKTEEPHEIIDEQVEATSEIEKENDEVAAELEKSKKNSDLSMEVKVYSPFKNYFEGEAFSVSAENLTGPFDILPKHHNFISLLTACELIIRTQKGEQKIDIAGGIMHVKANQLIVFLDV